jgi:signal peptidase I
MLQRLVNAITWLLVAGSVAIIAGGLTGRPILLASVPTPSMVPVLHPGDLIPVVPPWGIALRKGLVIVFRTEQDQTWIVHRIVGGDAEQGFITKGDANPVADPNPVFPQHVVGVVPQTGKGALHVPQLGLLSMERSPLSSPLVAGAALVLGVYLLAADAGRGFRRLSLAKLRKARMKELSGQTAMSIYAGLALAAFCVTFMSTWSLGSKRQGTYQVVASQATNVKVYDVITAGQVKTDTIQIKNGSPLPLIIGLDSSDPQLSWSPGWFVLAPHSEQEVGLELTAEQLGEHRAVFREGVYLPLLPLSVIRALAKYGWYLPVVATSVVPLLVVLVVAALDPRVPLQLRRIRQKMRLRMH